MAEFTTSFSPTKSLGDKTRTGAPLYNDDVSVPLLGNRAGISLEMSEGKDEDKEEDPSGGDATTEPRLEGKREEEDDDFEADADDWRVLDGV